MIKHKILKGLFGVFNILTSPKSQGQRQFKYIFFLQPFKIFKKIELQSI